MLRVVVVRVDEVADDAAQCSLVTAVLASKSLTVVVDQLQRRNFKVIWPSVLFV